MSELYLIERRCEIDAAHRAMFDGSKCSNLHGHRYTILVSCLGPLIEEGMQKGMVMDFGLLKTIMAQEIDEPCDHTTILWIKDPMVKLFLDDDALLENTIKPSLIQQGYYRVKGPITGMLYLLPNIPTAETLAAHWYHRIKPRIASLNLPTLRLHQVKVFESPHCMAAFPALP